MTQKDRRLYLLRALIKELPQYGKVEIPQGEAEQKRLLRALFNVRPPLPAPRRFLEIQDAYLSEEIRIRGVTDAASLAPVPADRRIYLWRGDITALKVDAIVNAANSALLGCFQPCHSCIDNSIHTFSGVQLRLACQELMRGRREAPGGAKLTPAYNLPCNYILHTVGPIVSGALRQQDCDLLESCYRSCLQRAAENKIESVAFCCISTGVFRFPYEKAAEIAVKTVSGFLAQNHSVRQVVFDVFTEKDLQRYGQLLGMERKAEACGR